MTDIGAFLGVMVFVLWCDGWVKKLIAAYDRRTAALEARP